MNFLGLGPGELMLIMVLALIVFGPGKLPEIARQIGKGVRDFRQSTAEINAEFQRSFSLEEPPPAAPEGPAAAPPGNGLAGAESITGQSAVSTAEPPLAEPSAWHWETADSVGPGPVEAAPGQSDGFWDWDAQRVAASADAAEAQPAPISSSTWEWDRAEPVVAITPAPAPAPARIRAAKARPDSGDEPA